jgi:DNA polymerase (family X)
MNNKQIAAKFDLLAKLLELHDENPFKIKSYANAYLSLRKLEGDMSAMHTNDLVKIPGVGSSIVDKIREMLQTGDMAVLAELRDRTPEGVQDMLKVKGLGPKKVKQIWKEMEIDTVGELLYACQENRLVSFKGFGEKLQSEIEDKLEYFISAQGKYLLVHVMSPARELVSRLNELFPDHKSEITGHLRRGTPIVDSIEILSTIETSHQLWSIDDWTYDEETSSWLYKGWKTTILTSSLSGFSELWYSQSVSEAFVQKYPTLANATDEQAIFDHHKIRYISPECREDIFIDADKHSQIDALVTIADIKGIVHNHSTYSDGLHTLEAMSRYVRDCGFEYFVISDHSKSAGYAGGLQVERVEMQMREIDLLNEKLGPDFKIYKSIESDILADGSLDYTNEVLGWFDLVIASVHSGLNMDVDKATARLITAIEHPATRILGHPTGRLLLARPGYPIDHKKVIDACAANNVVIELNANPQRLDIDYSWIPYCMDKGVMIAINPDAHSMQSIHYIEHGVLAARKGGLIKQMCLNTYDRAQFDMWLKK